MVVLLECIENFLQQELKNNQDVTNVALTDYFVLNGIAICTTIPLVALVLFN